MLEELELRRAIDDLLPYVNVEETRAELRRLVADPRFHGRQPGELRVVLASWGSGPAALEEIGREYRAWCAAAHRTNCHEGPLTASSIYEIAFDFAMGSQWDGFVGEVKSTIDPSTIRFVLLTGLVIFMATIAIPELLSKIPAAAATMVLTAYLGARAVCDLVFGWIQMVRELDAAKTFNDVRAAGQRYGHLVGTQTARILILLATAAIAEGGLIARLMKLPRAAQASAALAAETGGVGLEAVGAVKEVRVLQGGVAIAVEGAAQGAAGLAMAVQGPNPGTSSGATKPVDIKLKYKEGWTEQQRAEARAKVKALNEAQQRRVVKNPLRMKRSAASRYKSQGNSLPPGCDVDHCVDLQLNGRDSVENMLPLDSSVNRSLGAQIQQAIKDLPPGTPVGNITLE